MKTDVYSLSYVYMHFFVVAGLPCNLNPVNPPRPVSIAQKILVDWNMNDTLE